MLVIAAYVFFILVLGVLFAVLGRRAAVAQRRSAENLCLNCGYDLRASRHRCPECGAIPFRRLDRRKLRKPPLAVPTDYVAVSDEELDNALHLTTVHGEASLLATQLRMRGVPARLADGELAGNPFLILFQVYVRAVDLEKASEIAKLFEFDPDANVPRSRSTSLPAATLFLLHEGKNGDKGKNGDSR